jgi:hypothetical protein
MHRYVDETFHWRHSGLIRRWRVCPRSSGSTSGSKLNKEYIWCLCPGPSDSLCRPVDRYISSIVIIAAIKASHSQIQARLLRPQGLSNTMAVSGFMFRKDDWEQVVASSIHDSGQEDRISLQMYVCLSRTVCVLLLALCCFMFVSIGCEIEGLHFEPGGFRR